MNFDYFTFLVEKARTLIKRDIQYLIISPQEELRYFQENEKTLLVWKK